MSTEQNGYLPHPCTKTAPATIKRILLHRRIPECGMWRSEVEHVLGGWQAAARLGDLNGLHSAASVVRRATGTQMVSLLHTCDCVASSVLLITLLWNPQITTN